MWGTTMGPARGYYTITNHQWLINWTVVGLSAVAILLIILLIIGLVKRHKRRAPSGEALEIVRRRYALGEIDGETFERMKKDLR